MSAVIQNEYTGNNSTTTYSFTFPYLKTSDIKASLDGVATTAFTLPNATTLQFNTAPGSGVKIKIFRETSVDDLTATFYAGSAIKSEDLNDNFTQNLYKTQEVGARAISALGGTMTGNLVLDTQADLVFEGATADAHETTIKVVDPTADRTITFPNVTGTVVTTGDTGTVATGMIAADAIDGTKLADNAVNSEHYTDGSIDRVHLAADIVDGTKIADDSIDSEHLVADSIDSEHYAAGSVDATALASNAVTRVKIIADAVDGSKIADNSIDSEHYVDGSIDNEHIADNAINQAKMADDSIGAAEIIDNAVGSAALASNAVTLAKMADDSVGTSELVNDAVTSVKIADDAVLTAKIASGAITESRLGADSVTNAKIANNAVSSNEIASNAVTSGKIASSAIVEAKIASDAVTTTKISNDAVTTAKIADSELKTLAGMQSGTASKLADSTALTADIADLNQIDGLTKQTTISDSDASFPTSGAVVDYVAAQIAPLGGLEVIATEVAFPNTQPQAGVVISISDAGGVVFNGSGTSTTGRTVGGSTVTINNAPSSLNSETLVAGVGLMVSSTGSGQIYNYHKILGKEDDIKQLSDDINDFNARYRVGSSNPTSALDAGDLFFNTSTSKLLVYNATNTAWEEAQSIGNFFISTLSPAFDGSTQDFTITNAPANAQQILLSINGVVQKPNAGTSTPSEGFALSGSTVKLAAAPASGSIYHAVVLGSTVNIGTPSNNTVTSAILQNGSVIEAKLGTGAVTTNKIANDSVVTAKIADNTVTLAKLEHGTSSNDGKFLRANNGADPTFETVNTDLVADTSPQLGGNLDAGSRNIDFDDNGKLRLGSSNDLQIFHDGTDNLINNFGAPLAVHRATSNSGNPVFEVRSNHGATNQVKLQVDGDGSVRIPNDTGRLQIGASQDLQFYHTSGSANFIQASGGHANIHLSNLHQLKNQDNDAFMLTATNGGSVELYHNGNLRLETRTNDVKFHGGLVAIDNAQIQLGSSGDLKLYHDGTNSYIDNTITGILRIRGNTNDGVELHPKGGQYGLRTVPDGTTELYYSGSKKFETTNTGITVSGGLTANAGGFLDDVTFSTSGKGIRVTHTNESDGNDGIFAAGRFGTGLNIVGVRTETTGNRQIRLWGDIFPSNNIAENLGTSSNRWLAVHTNKILFHGDTATGNELDDYEEGSYTSLLNGGNFTASQGYNRYIKVGNIVHVSGRLAGFSSTTNGTDIAVSLPFACANLNSVWCGNSVWHKPGSSQMSNAVVPRALQNSSNMQFLVQGNNGGGSWFWLEYNDLHDSGTECFYHLTYHTA